MADKKGLRTWTQISGTDVWLHKLFPFCSNGNHIHIFSLSGASSSTLLQIMPFILTFLSPRTMIYIHAFLSHLHLCISKSLPFKKCYLCHLYISYFFFSPPATLSQQPWHTHHFCCLTWVWLLPSSMPLTYLPKVINELQDTKSNRCFYCMLHPRDCLLPFGTSQSPGGLCTFLVTSQFASSSWN